MFLLPESFFLFFFSHDLFSYFFKIIPPEDPGQNKSDYTSCCFVALICFGFIRRHLMLMIYGLFFFLFLFISVAFPLPVCFLSDLSVHFARPPFLSSHLTASSEPLLLLLELWEARLDTPSFL